MISRDIEASTRRGCLLFRRVLFIADSTANVHNCNSAGMSYSYDIVSAAPVGLGITPRQPLKELNHNVAQVDTESSTLTPELERAIRDMNTAQARGKLITLCKKYPSVCQELHKTVLGKSAPAKKKTVPQVRMAKCIQCNNQFDTMRNNTPACVWHTGSFFQLMFALFLTLVQISRLSMRLPRNGWIRNGATQNRGSS